MLEAINLIGGSYESTKNYTEALKYVKDAIPINLAQSDKRQLLGSYNWIGSIYAGAMMPDSGLVYSQISLNIAYELKNDSVLWAPLSTVAENYIAKGDYDLAMPFLRKSMRYVFTTLRKGEGISYFSWLNNDFAQAYLGMKQYDSSIYHAYRSLSFSIPDNDIPQQLRTYEYLCKSFDAMGRLDSSNKYFRMAASLKDSLFSMEKVKAIEAASFSALLRQQELDAEKKAEEEQRRLDLEFALIAIGIVSFIILFFLLSRSIIVNEKWISFFGILGLLIVFEFINLFIHPFLESVTHHSPVLMLLALVGIASLLIPIHHRIEKWIKEKMTEKNKKIRLENATKTIEKYQNE
jgi:tetratricopeptide (TPR) repeat protein